MFRQSFQRILRPITTEASTTSTSTTTATSYHPPTHPPWTPPSTLRYPLHPLTSSNFLPSGFTPPIGKISPKIPFYIFRTTKAKQLPVYTAFRNGRTRCLTAIRRFRGDQNALANEMSVVCDGRPVSVRQGKVEVVGNYAGRVREWLLRLGF